MAMDDYEYFLVDMPTKDVYLRAINGADKKVLYPTINQPALYRAIGKLPDADDDYRYADTVDAPYKANLLALYAWNNAYRKRGVTAVMDATDMAGLCLYADNQMGKGRYYRRRSEYWWIHWVGLDSWDDADKWRDVLADYKVMPQPAYKPKPHPYDIATGNGRDSRRALNDFSVAWWGVYLHWVDNTIGFQQVESIVIKQSDMAKR